MNSLYALRQEVALLQRKKVTSYQFFNALYIVIVSFACVSAILPILTDMFSIFQPYSQQPCSGCKAAVTKSRSAHWEGGKGCRDKISMSRLVHVPVFRTFISEDFLMKQDTPGTRSAPVVRLRFRKSWNQNKPFTNVLLTEAPSLCESGPSCSKSG